MEKNDEFVLDSDQRMSVDRSLDKEMSCVRSFQSVKLAGHHSAGGIRFVEQGSLGRQTTFSGLSDALSSARHRQVGKNKLFVKPIIKNEEAPDIDRSPRGRSGSESAVQIGGPTHF